MLVLIGNATRLVILGPDDFFVSNRSLANIEDAEAQAQRHHENDRVNLSHHHRYDFVQIQCLLRVGSVKLQSSRLTQTADDGVAQNRQKQAAPTARAPGIQLEAKSELTSGLIHVFAKNDSLLSYAIDFDIERREAGAALQKKHRQKHTSLSMSSQQYRL